MHSETQALLPHRPPMQWIEELIECTDTEAKATTRFTNEHFAAHNESVLESALVECVAQTVAAALGFRAKKKGSSNHPAGLGMLAAVSNFRIETRPELNTTMEISIKEVRRLGPMLMIAGVITQGARTIASGELSLYA